MTLTIHLENGLTVEIEEQIHGHYFNHCKGGYEQESEYIHAFLFRNGKIKQVNVNNIVRALERRLGQHWAEFAEVT